MLVVFYRRAGSLLPVLTRRSDTPVVQLAGGLLLHKMRWNLMGITWAVALCVSWQGHCAVLPELNSSMMERASAVQGPEQPLQSVPLEAGSDVVASSAQQMHLASLAHR